MPVDNQKYWDELLIAEGLSMTAGSSPARLSYGWNNPDWQNRKPFDYTTALKPIDRRGGARKGTGPKALCVRHISTRCSCRACVKVTPNSNLTIGEEQ